MLELQNEYQNSRKTQIQDFQQPPGADQYSSYKGNKALKVSNNNSRKQIGGNYSPSPIKKPTGYKPTQVDNANSQTKR